MTTHTKRAPGKGIVQPIWERPRARNDRIAIFKLTGWPAFGEKIDAAFGKPQPRPHVLWRVDVGDDAQVAPIDQGRTISARYFWEAIELADSIRRRAEDFHRLQSVMPSRLCPRPNHTHFETWPHGVPPL